MEIDQVEATMFKMGPQFDQKIADAKQKELRMMEQYDDFEEIEKANHQCKLNGSVATEKSKNGKQVVMAKS